MIFLGVLWCRIFVQSSEHVLGRSDSQGIQNCCCPLFCVYNKMFCLGYNVDNGV